MKTLNPRFIPSVVLCCLAIFSAGANSLGAAPDIFSAADWPSFRGLQARGVSDASMPPEKWDVERKENVRWQTEIPGLGHSSPIIFGERIFVTTAVGEGGNANLKVGLYGDIAPVNDTSSHEWKVLCLEKPSGKILWNKVAHTGVPKIKRHPKASHANPTPATDGKNLVSFFASEGLYCFDLDGNLRWQKDLGILDSGFFRSPTAQWEFASSPVISGDRVIVQCDVLTNSFLAAYDLKDGKRLWRVDRDDLPTWSTPAVISSGGRTQIVVNGYKHAGAYSLDDGHELWRLAGGGDIPVPTPITAHGLVYLTSAHGPVAPIYAIDLNAMGDITLATNTTTNQFIRWSVPRRGNYMQTPIVVGNELYCCNDAGVLTCYNAVTGEVYYSERLGNGSMGFTASAVASGDRIYFASETGKVVVVKVGRKFEILATNDLGDQCMATPAISDGMIYFRTQHRLVAIGR